MTPEEYATAPLEKTGTAIQDALERIAVLEKQVFALETYIRNLETLLLSVI